jgi:ribokinase
MILVFGSINVDLSVPVPRLPRPGETVLGGDYKLLPGGKGANQALAARRAGATVLFAGTVGADRFADIALEPLRREGVDTRLVQVVEQPTGCAAIMVSEAGENLIAVASGDNMSERSNQIADELLGPDITFVAQMEVPTGETAALIRRVRARRGRVLLNLAPALPIDRTLLKDIDLVIANEAEAASLGSDQKQLAGQLRQGLVVTRGAAGSIAFDGRRRHLRRRSGGGTRFRIDPAGGASPGRCRGGFGLPGARCPNGHSRQRTNRRGGREAQLVTWVRDCSPRRSSFGTRLRCRCIVGA